MESVHIWGLSIGTDDSLGYFNVVEAGDGAEAANTPVTLLAPQLDQLVVRLLIQLLYLCVQVANHSTVTRNGFFVFFYLAHELLFFILQLDLLSLQVLQFADFVLFFGSCHLQVVIDLIDFALLGFPFILQLLGVIATLLLGLGQIGNDLVVDVLFPRQLLLQLLLVQVAQLQLTHQLVHGVAVKELAIADLAYFTPNLILWVFISGGAIVLLVHGCIAGSSCLHFCRRWLNR